MASEVFSAKEGGVMGLRSRNAIGGRTDRAHGRASLPAQNPSSTKKVMTPSEIRSASFSAQDRLNEMAINGEAPSAGKTKVIPIGNGAEIQVTTVKSPNDDGISGNANYVKVSVVENGREVESEKRYYGRRIEIMGGGYVTPSTAMRQFYKRNSHLFERYR